MNSWVEFVFVSYLFFFFINGVCVGGEGGVTREGFYYPGKFVIFE